MKPRAVPARAAPMPPSKPASVSSPKLFSSPSSQPLRTRGKVSQLGTLSFHPSMTAARIMAAQTIVSGQWFRMKFIGSILTLRGSLGVSPAALFHAASRETSDPAARCDLVGERRVNPPLATIGHSAGGRVDLVADVAEGVAGIGAQRADGRDADDDDQGQHDRVLNCRRAVFGSQKILDLGDPVLHDQSPCVT